MKIKLFQYRIEWEDKEKNIELLNAEIKKAKIDLILLPEMSFTGFSMNIDNTGEDDSSTIDIIKKMALENAVAIGFGWVERTELKGKNHYSIVDKNGILVGDYVKIHPFSFAKEDRFFDSGDSIVFFELNNVRFSTVICYDLRFPELFQVASSKSDVLVVPANWPRRRKDHWITLLKARAIENQVYIFAINCVGNIGGIDYSGDSCVINPNGEMLDMISDKEGNITFDFENDVGEHRRMFPTKNDRKNKLYITLYEEFLGQNKNKN